MPCPNTLTGWKVCGLVYRRCPLTQNQYENKSLRGNFRNIWGISWPLTKTRKDRNFFQKFCVNFIVLAETKYFSQLHKQVFGHEHTHTHKTHTEHTHTHTHTRTSERRQHMKLQQPRNYDFQVSQFSLLRSRCTNDHELTTSPPGPHWEAMVALTTTAKVQQLRANNLENDVKFWSFWGSEFLTRVALFILSTDKIGRLLWDSEEKSSRIFNGQHASQKIRPSERLEL